ncbi:hypothetical protein F0562_023812 [Nyssa sinensis]|uniref:Uncharacterized protein n=1 Tax=Nyssa sinensis TaxID=561372 RepID=A0A5J5BIU6_9ASTE|nr:hypothetical protein F0562_023812 [Nyssa sinensis]
MGRPDQADPSLYYHAQPESDPQPQEYQYEAGTLDDAPPPIYETCYNDENRQETYQQQSSNPPENDQQSQQQFEPPPPLPQSQQPAHYQPQNPQPQANYTTQPARPAPYPAQTPQIVATQPVPLYPPQQHPEMVVPPRTPPITYPPQANPQAFPPQNGPQPFPPQAEAQAYPPQANPQAYPPQAKPQAFPPQADPQAYPPQGKQQAYPPSVNPQAFPSQTAFEALRPVQFPPPAGFLSQKPMGGQMGYAQPQFSPAGPVKGSGTTIGSSAPATEGWKTGLFDCMDDPGNALVTACFPCLTFGQIAEIVDNGHTSWATSGMLYCVIASFIGIPCLMSCTYRTKLRNQHGLVESPAPDWVTHFCCEWCALCQEYRELQLRGFDPSIGWLGNMNRNQQQQVGMVPPMHQTMMG